MNIFLPMILVLGIITSYTDIKYGKIRNIWIIIALSYAAIAYTIIGNYEFNITSGPLSFYAETLINISISVVIGVTFWLNEYWSAADGKLFIAFAVLTPVTVYSQSYFRFFPAVSILMFTMLILTFIVFIQLLIKLRIKDIKHAILNLEPPDIIKSLVILFIVQGAFQILTRLLGIDPGIIGLVLFIIIVMPLLTNIIRNKIYLLVILAIIRIIVDTSVFSIDFIKEFSILGLLYLIFRFFLSNVSERIFSKEIKIKNLKIGMVLAEYIVKDKNKYIITKTPKKKPYIMCSPEGIDRAELKKLRKIGISEQKILVHKHTYFAPYLFAGTLISIVTGGFA